MSGGQIIGLMTIVFIFGGPMIVGIVYAAINGWVKVQAHREDTDLKHTLVNAGFSADEIERIVNAGRKRGKNEDETDAIRPFEKTNVKAG